MTGRLADPPSAALDLRRTHPGTVAWHVGLFTVLGCNVSEWCCQRYYKYHKTGRVKKDRGCQPACAVPLSLSHGHGPGGTSANSALYSPLGKMHDGLVIIVLDESQDSCPLML